MLNPYANLAMLGAVNCEIKAGGQMILAISSDSAEEAIKGGHPDTT
jgi:hypothetical protein